VTFFVARGRRCGSCQSSMVCCNGLIGRADSQEPCVTPQVVRMLSSQGPVGLADWQEVGAIGCDGDLREAVDPELDDYDPRKPEYVTTVSEQERRQLDSAILRSQMHRLEANLRSRRSRSTAEGSDEVCRHYEAVLGEMRDLTSPSLDTAEPRSAPFPLPECCTVGHEDSRLMDEGSWSGSSPSGVGRTWQSGFNAFSRSGSSCLHSLRGAWSDADEVSMLIPRRLASGASSVFTEATWDDVMAIDSGGPYGVRRAASQGGSRRKDQELETDDLQPRLHAEMEDVDVLEVEDAGTLTSLVSS